MVADTYSDLTGCPRYKCSRRWLAIPPGASYRLMRSLGQSGWQPQISVALALEYEDVLKRTGMVSVLTEAEIDRVLDYLFRVSRLIPSIRRLRPVLPDPRDEHILEVAVFSRVMITT